MNTPIQYPLLFILSLSIAISGNLVHAKDKPICSSISTCTPLAQSSNLEAQYILGTLLAKQRKPESNRKAFYWIRKAAKKGFVPAQFSLGVIYSEGLGEEVKADETAAFKWYLKAAESSHAEAQFSVGTMLIQSSQLETDYASAAQWFTRAANQKHARAQFTLGTLYFAGLGVKQDFKEALNWYTKSADNGHIEALFNVGMMNYQGQGTSRDIHKGLQSIKQAAAQGEHNAMHFLRNTQTGRA